MRPGCGRRASARRVSPTQLELPRTGFVRHPDTGLIDAEGDFDHARLNAVFARHGTTFQGAAITLPELSALLALRVLKDATRGAWQLLMLPVGAAAVVVEWGALFWLAGTKRGDTRVLERESVRRFYTDALFLDDVARRIANERARRGETRGGAARNVLQNWLL